MNKVYLDRLIRRKEIKIIGINCLTAFQRMCYMIVWSEAKTFSSRRLISFKDIKFDKLYKTFVMIGILIYYSI